MPTGLDEEDECIHGLDPVYCSVCLERRRAAERPASAPKVTRTRAPSVRAAAAKATATKKPSTAAQPARVAGRKEYFGEGPAVWWVDQTGRKDEEWAEGVVTSRRSGIAVPAHQRNVGELRTGDLTIHVAGGEIVAVGEVSGDGHVVDGADPGWLAEVLPTPLAVGIPVGELDRDLKPGPPGPFTNPGFVQAGTCFPFPHDHYLRLARRYVGLWPEGTPIAEAASAKR